MRTLKITLYAEVGLFSELPRDEQDLLRASEVARASAQAPYSNYWVGAAVISGSDKILSVGCNVENVAYCGIHAEDNAITNMVCQLGPSKVDKLAFIAAPAKTRIDFKQALIGKPITDFQKIGSPCAVCLQKIWENCFDDPTVPILCLLPNGEVSRTPIGSLYPVRFGPSALGIDYANLIR